MWEKGLANREWEDTEKNTVGMDWVRGKYIHLCVSVYVCICIYVNINACVS